MANPPCALAEANTPGLPAGPTAWYTTSAPPPYSPSAASRASRSPAPSGHVESCSVPGGTAGGGARYFADTWVPGEPASAPARYPASASVNGAVWHNARKPTWWVREVRAATTPIRYAPCASAKTRLATFGASTVGSPTMAKWVAGQARAARATGPFCGSVPAYRSPIAMTGLYPDWHRMMSRSYLSSADSSGTAANSCTALTGVPEPYTKSITAVLASWLTEPSCGPDWLYA